MLDELVVDRADRAPAHRDEVLVDPGLHFVGQSVVELLRVLGVRVDSFVVIFTGPQAVDQEVRSRGRGLAAIRIFPRPDQADRIMDGFLVLDPGEHSIKTRQKRAAFQAEA